MGAASWVELVVGGGGGSEVVVGGGGGSVVVGGGGGGSEVVGGGGGGSDVVSCSVEVVDSSVEDDDVVVGVGVKKLNVEGKKLRSELIDVEETI